MSCIQEILKKKGDKDFLEAIPNELVIEGGGHYKGYDYLITFNNFGHRCAYVAISPDHPLYNKEGYDDIELEMHGGCTFFEKHDVIQEAVLGQHTCEDKWIGFDAGHYQDGVDLKAAEKYFNFNDMRPYRLGHLKERHEMDKGWRSTIKTKKFMEKECKSILDHLCKE
jgi:hypothetical protein